MRNTRIEQIRSGLHVSASALKTYLMCPWKFRLQYVEGVQPEFRPSAMVLGRAVHEALARFHLAVMSGDAMGEEEVRQAFDDALDRDLAHEVPVQFSNGDDPGKLGEVGRGLVDVYRREVKLGRIIDAEKPFRVQLVDPRTGEVLEPELVGVFDLLEENDNGAVSVVEIKTANRRWSDGQVDQDLQGSLYAHALVEAGLAPENDDVSTVFRVLVKNRQPVFDSRPSTRGPQNRRNALMVAVDVLRSIEKDAFHRAPSWACSGCPFRSRCGI